MVEKVIEGKKKEIDTRELEGEIDKIVYGLYGLTEEEVGIIEEKWFYAPLLNFLNAWTVWTEPYQNIILPTKYIIAPKILINILIPMDASA